MRHMLNFVLAALEPLGLKEMMRPIPNSVGLGDQTPFFWVTGVEGDAKTLEAVMQGEHTAFSAASKSVLVVLEFVLCESCGCFNGAVRSDC